MSCLQSWNLGMGGEPKRVGLSAPSALPGINTCTPSLAWSLGVKELLSISFSFFLPLSPPGPPPLPSSCSTPSEPSLPGHRNHR